MDICDLTLYDDCVTSTTAIVHLVDNTEIFLYDFDWDNVDNINKVNSIKLSSILSQINNQYKNFKSINVSKYGCLRGKEWGYDKEDGQWKFIGRTRGIFSCSIY